MAKKKEPRNELPPAAKVRDFVEQIAIAVVLALMFRGFEGEAFVIPTGSMAPTLMGMHKDFACEKCGFPIRVGAIAKVAQVGNAVCQSCRYVNSVDPAQKVNRVSFSGDRIVVNKFAYQFWEPERWDVIVFKYPGNPKQNYIKRLIGLPGETIQIYGGDVYRVVDGKRQILRKPAKKLRHLLQVVHDTQYVAPELVAANYPASWESTSPAWKIASDQRSFRVDTTDDTTAWLRYRHVPPNHDTWRSVIRRKEKFPDVVGGGSLISDYCGYNAYKDFRSGGPDPNGFHWVGDLAVDCEVTVESASGEILLDLVEAGRHHRCSIDVGTGRATLSINDGQVPFDGGAATVIGSTKINGPGSYDIQFANIDDELTLWVNKKAISFSEGDSTSGRYTAPSPHPVWTESDPGDLNAARVGGKGLAAVVGRVRVLRDIYYVSEDSSRMRTGCDYTGVRSPGRFFESVQQLFASPEKWAQSDLFSRRRDVTFSLGEDQFFPMGDNSPASKDARLWGETFATNVPGEGMLTIDPWVTRERLIGKAFLVYWPHPWQVAKGVPPFLPNVRRMGRIR